MKVALYIEDGLEQIVLTGETDLERSILAKLSDANRTLTIAHGSFYGCQGGWTRWSTDFNHGQRLAGNRQDDRSTMIILRPKSPEEAA